MASNRKRCEIETKLDQNIKWDTKAISAKYERDKSILSGDKTTKTRDFV